MKLSARSSLSGWAPCVNGGGSTPSRAPRASLAVQGLYVRSQVNAFSDLVNRANGYAYQAMTPLRNDGRAFWRRLIPGWYLSIRPFDDCVGPGHTLMLEAGLTSVNWKDGDFARWIQCFLTYNHTEAPWHGFWESSKGLTSRHASLREKKPTWG